MLGDRAYDSAELRQWLSARGTKSVVPNKSNRKQSFSFDRKSYKQRHRIENAFCRLKDFRRIATLLRQTGQKLPRFRLPYRRYRMVDIMSLGPSWTPRKI